MRVDWVPRSVTGYELHSYTGLALLYFDFELLFAQMNAEKEEKVGVRRD